MVQVPEGSNKDFYEGILKPVIEEYAAAGGGMDKDGAWDAASLKNADSMLGEWMEFSYKVSELRKEYLLNKLCADEQ